MSTSTSPSNSSLGIEEYYGCLIPRSSKVDAIVFAKESNRKTWTIGRGEFNAAVLPSTAISLTHANVICEADMKGAALMYIEDVSTNGIWINGQRIPKETRTLLKDGAAVHFGQLYEHNDENRDFRFIFRLNDTFAPPPSLSGSRIPELNKDYDVLERIGSGSICQVLLAVERASNECVAIKLYQRGKNFQREAMDRERTLLQHLPGHENLCAYKASSVDAPESKVGYLVFEYVNGMNLRKFMNEHKNAPISEVEVQHIVLQICKAIQHLHDPNRRLPGTPRALLGAVAHADLKPENILLMDDVSTVKVADFNAVIFAGETLNDVRGAEAYMAPEMAHPATVDHFIDNYSVGVLAFELLTGTLPYVNKTPAPPTAQARIAARVAKNLKAALRTRSAEALDFIERLLEHRAGKRMSMNEALDHPWLDGAGRSARSKGKRREVSNEEDDIDMRPASPMKDSAPADCADGDNSDVDMRPASPIKRITESSSSPTKTSGVRFPKSAKTDAGEPVFPKPASSPRKSRTSTRAQAEKPTSQRVTRSMAGAAGKGK